MVLSKINDLRLREIRNITVGFSYPAKKRCGPQTSFFGCWLLKSGCHQTVDTVCNLRLINVILCLDLESRISFVTHRHSAGDHSHQSPKLQCPLLRLSVLCCQGGMSISLISGLPSPRLTAAHDSGKSDKENFVVCSPSPPFSAAPSATVKA